MVPIHYRLSLADAVGTSRKGTVAQAALETTNAEALSRPRGSSSVARRASSATRTEDGLDGPPLEETFDSAVECLPVDAERPTDRLDRPIDVVVVVGEADH